MSQQRRLYGAANALNMLIFHEPDLAAALKFSAVALADFEAAGYIERQAMMTSNMGITYAALGLYRHARRLYLKTKEIYRCRRRSFACKCRCPADEAEIHGASRRRLEPISPR